MVLLLSVLPRLPFFGIELPSYAVMMAAGYLAALAAVWFLVPRRRRGSAGIDRPQAFDLFLVMVASSLIGAKVGHVLFEAPGHVTADGRTIESLWELLREDPWHVLRFGEGGYVWYGGMIGALVTAVIYFRRRPGLNGWLYADAFAPAIMVGAAFGRVGCFMSGCCYGVPTELPWGIDFPATAGPVHPTQLYDATFAAICGAVLLHRFGRRRFDGENIALLLIAYPVARFTTEMLRGDPERGGLGPFSTSQWLSLGVGAIGVWLYGAGVNARGATDPAGAGSEPSEGPTTDVAEDAARSTAEA
mgnify:FL=1